MHQQDLEKIRGLIRTIPDFPKPGIQFRDVSTLFKDAWGLKRTVELLAERLAPHQPTKVVAIESRGFVLGAPIAQILGCGMIMARKPGKLPGKTAEVEYQLEYGSDKIQIHVDAISGGDRCVVVDDLLATGGTCEATCKLVEQLGGTVVGTGFVVNLPELHGDKRIERYHPNWLVYFSGH